MFENDIGPHDFFLYLFLILYLLHTDGEDAKKNSYGPFGVALLWWIISFSFSNIEINLIDLMITPNFFQN